MDFRFSEEEERLRVEVRLFLRDNVPPLPVVDRVGTIGNLVVTEDGFRAGRAFNRRLAERGWIAPAWPKEYGGLGATVYEQMVFNEEFGYANPPDTGTRALGVGLLGPTLIIHGSDEQKRKHLQAITSGEVIWCAGLSEPNAGSDLANIETRAVRDGDDYLLSGQKIWTSEAHHADWIFVLARTDPDAPKHKGLSYFLVDMTSPGVSVRPLIHLANRHHFNEVFLDNVRVPKANMVGEENRGWYVAVTTLDSERSGIGGFAANYRRIETLADYLREHHNGTRSHHRLALADLAIANEVGKCISYRVGDLQAKGHVPSHEGSMLKIYQTELMQRLYGFGINMLGLWGQLVPEDPHAPFEGEMAQSYMTASPASIYAGTNEIQRNIIAQRGLGLPRD